MKNYSYNAKKFAVGLIGCIIIIILTALFSCEKEQCWVCDKESRHLVVLSSGVYYRWDFMKQEIVCGELPGMASKDDFFRYTNCIPE